MQILGRESAEFVDFDGEMSKNHRDRIPNNEHTEGKREGTRGISREHQTVKSWRLLEPLPEYNS